MPSAKAHEDDRYARQRLIPDWQQDTLTGATVLVAGAGALGNETLKNLALLGVGHLLILDMDTIAPSNLSRTVLFRPVDVGTSKAHTAAAAVRALNPESHITVLDGDLRFVLGLGRLRACSLVLGCLDNQGARAFLNRMGLAVGVPYLDAAMWDSGGEVRAFLTPDAACFDCTLSPAERTHLWMRYSCSGGLRLAEDEPPAPTTITTTAIIAGLLAQEAVRVLGGAAPDSGTALVYNGLSERLYRTHLARDPQCPNHTPLDWDTIRHLPAPATDLTAREVLLRAQPDLDGPPTLDLGRDLLLAFVCPDCGDREERMQMARLVDAGERPCPCCGAERDSLITSTVTLDDPWATRTLAQLGVPDGDVVSVRGSAMLIMYVLPVGT